MIKSLQCIFKYGYTNQFFLETNIHKSIVNVLTYALRQFALTGLLKNQLLKLEGEHIHSVYRKII